MISMIITMIINMINMIIIGMFQIAMIDTITKLAPPRLAATAISIMATLVWVIGKGVKLVTSFNLDI